MKLLYVTKLIFISTIFFVFSSAYAQAIKVEVQKVDDQWVLMRGGAPYYINGAGGEGFMEELVEAGGNSVRTWSVDDAQEVLDKAQELGLTVMMGLWVQHERHGYDYDNEIANQGQLEYFTKMVKKYKDHPALLMWSIGNEVDLFYSNTKVWDVVQDIAAMIHEVDPNHPTNTVTAGLDPKEVKLIMDRAPDIDIYGINTYGEVSIIRENIRAAGWDKPYIISEWGPNGHWEVSKTKWSAPIEQTSHEKALSYFDRYNNHILPDKEMCIGSYVFLWGQKQETTSTWFSMFTNEGDETEVMDVMIKGWTGKLPDNQAPKISNFTLSKRVARSNIILNTSTILVADVNISDPEGDEITYQWQVIPESMDKKTGGDKEKAPKPIKGIFKKADTKSNTVNFTVRLPGEYRLFIFAKDGNGNVATGNIPFKIIE